MVQIPSKLRGVHPDAIRLIRQNRSIELDRSRKSDRSCIDEFSNSIDPPDRARSVSELDRSLYIREKLSIDLDRSQKSVNIIPKLFRVISIKTAFGNVYMYISDV